jgi:hypothetical protein
MALHWCAFCNKLKSSVERYHKCGQSYVRCMDCGHKDAGICNACGRISFGRTGKVCVKCHMNHIKKLCENKQKEFEDAKQLFFSLDKPGPEDLGKWIYIEGIGPSYTSDTNLGVKWKRCKTKMDHLENSLLELWNHRLKLERLGKTT